MGFVFSCRCVLCYARVMLTESELKLWSSGDYEVVCDDTVACARRAQDGTHRGRAVRSNRDAAIYLGPKLT